MGREIDYYELLCISPKADLEIVRAAYRVLVKRYHPDLATGSKEHSLEKFRLITGAYATLSNIDRRRQYDEHRNRRDAYEQGNGHGSGNPESPRNRSTERRTSQSRGSNDERNKANSSTSSNPDHSSRAHGKARTAFKWAGGIVALVVLIGVLAPTRDAARQPALDDAPPQEATQAESAQSLAMEARRHAADNELKEHERQAQIAWAKEVERLSRVQAIRAKAAEDRLAASARPGRSSTTAVEANAKTNAATESASTVTTRRSVCTSHDGIAFSITNQDGEVSISYNGARPVRAKVEYQGEHLVVLSRIVPNNAVEIGVARGAQGGTTVMFSDTGGNLGSAIGATCSGRAF